MKTLLYVLLFFSGLTQVQAQLTTFYVRPETINAGYTAAQDSHYVAFNPSVTSNGKLLVFFPGTGALTKHYLLFPQLAANLGYHCISVAYPNGSPTVAQMCAGNSDADCYRDIHEEVCYGNDVSTNVTVDDLNSIHDRMVSLLQYLHTQYPSAGWGAFLSSNEPVWNMITLSGHSQGSGHALYLAKTKTCDRLIMFAGANDYSNYYSSSANWVSEAGLTNPSRYFSLLHLRDEVWDYAKQYAVVKDISMTAYGDDSTKIDFLSAPYSNSHCLYTDIEPLHPALAGAYHNGMAVDFFTPLAMIEPVWTYMLSTMVVDGILDAKSKASTLKLYPNPVTEQLNVTCTSAISSAPIQVLNMYGEVLIEEILEGSGSSFSTSELKPGVYLLRVNNECVKFVKEQ